MALWIKVAKDWCFNKFLSQLVKACLALVVRKARFLDFDNFLFKASLFIIINSWDDVLATKLALSIEMNGAAILLNLWIKRQ